MTDNYFSLAAIADPGANGCERRERLRSLQACLGRAVPVLQSGQGDYLPPLLLQVHTVQKVQPRETHEEQAYAAL